MPGRAAAPAEVSPLPKGHTAGSVPYEGQQISPGSIGDLAPGLVALPRLPWRDSEWKRENQLGEIPGAWRGRGSTRCSRRICSLLATVLTC